MGGSTGMGLSGGGSVGSTGVGMSGPPGGAVGATGSMTRAL